MRKNELQTGEYYHIYNRGVDGRDIFCDEKDYLRFLRGMREFNNHLGDVQRDYIKRMREKEDLKNLSNLSKSDFGYPKSDFMPLVDIICYCLNTNHYHFILRQNVEDGITNFMRKIGTGYTNYFNLKYSRSGSLFQGKFKSIHITTNEYLLWLSGYIHGNPEIHKIAKEENWQWSSYQDYLGKRNGTLCDKNVILNEFGNVGEYKRLVDEIIKDSRERKDEIKKLLLE